VTAVIVILLVAVVCMLVAGVIVAVLRLRTALVGLREAGERSAGVVQPLIDELTEASAVTSVEAAQLQASIEQLQAGRGAG
jgi:hypothetical protein